jgi:hypothetical protein
VSEGQVPQQEGPVSDAGAASEASAEAGASGADESDQTREERRAERRSRRWRRVIALVVVVLLGCCGLYAISRAAEPEALTLMRERCTECHSLGRALSGERDHAGWQSIVFRMQGYGAEVTNEERGIIVDYLTERSEG